MRILSKTQKAFTLIELLVVISIIGLLSSVVLASLSGARESARIAAAKQFEHNIRASVSDCSEALYNFEGDSSTVVREASGYSGRDGAIQGDPIRVDGLDGLGQAMEFDGAGDYVSVPIDVFAANNSWTFGTWFKNTNINKHIHFTGISTQHADGWTPLSHFGVRNSKLAWWDGSGGWREGATTLEEDKWYHVLIEGNGNGAVKMYLDGQLDHTETNSIQNNIGRVENFGRRQHSDDRYYEGYLDNIRIYSCAFSGE